MANIFTPPCKNDSVNQEPLRMTCYATPGDLAPVACNLFLDDLDDLVEAWHVLVARDDDNMESLQKYWQIPSAEIAMTYYEVRLVLELVGDGIVCQMRQIGYYQFRNTVTEKIFQFPVSWFDINTIDPENVTSLNTMFVGVDHYGTPCITFH